MTEAPPSTADYLEFHAIHQPGAIALIDGGREYTYGQFDRDLRRFTRVARSFGLARGGLVAIASTDTYVHWLLLLAFENIGMVTTSFQRGEGEVLRPLLSRADLTICGAEVEAPGAGKIQALTEAWLEAIFLAGDGEAAESDTADIVKFDEPMRVVRSSGTTGSPKMILKTRRHYEHRFQSQLLNEASYRHARLLFLIPFAINLAYVRAVGCVRAGGTVIFDDAISAAQAIVTYKPNYIQVLPLKLAEILDGLPNDFAKPEFLSLRVSGAALPPALRERALSRLATEILANYGSNETAVISSVDATGAGTLFPGVDVELVDDDETPVPEGEIGRIRVRAEGAVDGYLDDPEATARMFRDGWFYTGDLGVMEGRRRLRVLGRHDEFLNIGGLKMSPDLVADDLARNCFAGNPAIRGIAVTSIVNAGGFEEICVALATDAPIDIAAASAAIRRYLPSYLGEVHIQTMDALPRTATGKIARQALREAFARR